MTLFLDSLERIADLPAVPSVAVPPVAFREIFDLFVADEDIATRSLESAQIHVTDPERAFFISIGVIETYVDAGYEGLVKGADPVCCTK